MEQVKIGHQAPIGRRVNTFNSIEIEGDFSYCISHNFVYNSEQEKEKLYNGKPCYYTDKRFYDSMHNSYHRCKLHWTRWSDISLKACIRKVMRCKNIPIGTVISFEKSWYEVGSKFRNHFNFKVKKENKLDLQFEINHPSYSQQFTNCEFSKKLTEALRENGFIVSIKQNESFLGNLVNSAIAYTGSKELQDTTIEGDVAVAYGYGKKIGFSSFNNDFFGYSNGCKNILWDRFGEFDKWSRCNEIDKTTSIEDILEILMRQNPDTNEV